MYTRFGCRRDALFELLDALLTAPSIETLEAKEKANDSHAALLLAKNGENYNAKQEVWRLEFQLRREGAKGGSAILVTSTLPVALYARVSTTHQVEAQTVDSQIAALHERIVSDAAEGFLTKEEFEPRITRLRQRIAQFEAALAREIDEASMLHEFRLVIGRMEEFAAHVRAGLADTDWSLRRDIIRALVKRIDVTDAHITVVFRVGAHTLGPAPPHHPWPRWWPRLAAQASERVRSTV